MFECWDCRSTMWLFATLSKHRLPLISFPPSSCRTSQSKIKLLLQLPRRWCRPAKRPAVDHNMKQRGFAVSSLSCHVAPIGLTIHIHSTKAESVQSYVTILIFKATKIWAYCSCMKQCWPEEPVVMLLPSVHVSLQGQITVQSGLVDVLLSLFLQVSCGCPHKACKFPLFLQTKM